MDKADPNNGSVSAAAEPDPSKINETTSTEVPLYSWMVRPCNTYKEEYKDCKSFKERFNQYFVDGKMKDCSQWQEDYKNCQAWESGKGLEYFKKVIDSETERSRRRLKAHYDNDVWEHRDKPPEDWNKELPESIRKEYEASYLHFKAIEIKEKNINLELNEDEEESSSCTIV